VRIEEGFYENTESNQPQQRQFLDGRERVRNAERRELGYRWVVVPRSKGTVDFCARGIRAGKQIVSKAAGYSIDWNPAVKEYYGKS
jgi:hypothetical protein